MLTSYTFCRFSVFLTIRVTVNDKTFHSCWQNPIPGSRTGVRSEDLLPHGCPAEPATASSKTTRQGRFISASAKYQRRAFPVNWATGACRIWQVANSMAFTVALFQIEFFGMGAAERWFLRCASRLLSGLVCLSRILVCRIWHRRGLGRKRRARR